MRYKERNLGVVNIQRETDTTNSLKETSAHLLLSETKKIAVVQTLKEFQALKLDWQSLNNQSLKGNIFTSWEWLYTWWEIYQKDGVRQLYILTFRDEQKNLLGLAPFQLINNPKKYFPCSRQLVMLGTGETDGSGVFGEYMDLLIAPGHEEVVMQLFSQYLYEKRNLWDGLKFHQILKNSHVEALFSDYSGNKKATFICTVEAYGFRTIITLPETYNAYLMSLRKKMRNNITRVFSRLEREQEYTIEEVKDRDELDGAIRLLAELNRTRRSNMELSSSFDYISFENYHRKLVQRLFQLNETSKGFSLKIMRFAEQPVAMLYCFIDGDTIHAYQSGFETDYGRRYSLLTTMLTQEIASSIENKNIKYFNFMFADDESTYKHRYSGETENLYNISIDHNNAKGKFYLFLHGPFKTMVKKFLLLIKQKQG